MKRYKSPKASEMVEAYEQVKAIGLRNVRLANTGIFGSTVQAYHLLKDTVGVGNY